MLQYQIRLAKEKAQLEERLGKLTTFIESPQIGNVPAAEADLLREQARVMRLYSEILEQRIDGWVLA